MPVTIRTATKTDLAALIALNNVVQRLHAELYPDDFGAEQDVPAMQARFAALLEAPRNTLLIGEADGVVAGYVWIEHQVRPPSPFYHRRDRMMIHHLSVAPEIRRRGVAAALFQAVEAQAARLGVTDITLETWAANMDAHAFFTAQGYSALKLMFRKRLG